MDQDSRWGMLAILFSARTALAFQFQSVATVSPYITNAFSVDFATVGLLIGCHMLPGIVLAFPSGVAAERYGSRRAITLGLGLMLLGGLVMTADSLPLLFIGRIVSGIGAVILNVQITRAVVDWFSSKEIVVVSGMLVASWPLGIALALVLLPSVAMMAGLKAVMLAAAIPALVCFVLIVMLYRDPPTAPARIAGVAPRLDADVWRQVVLAGVIWGCYNAAYVIFVAALPGFFELRGLDLRGASAVASIFGWVLIVTLPLGGLIAQKLGRSTNVMVGCLLVNIAAVLGLVWSDAVAASLFVLTVAIGLPAGAILALPSMLLPPERRSGGMGAFFTIFYVAMATLPALAGAVRDATGDVRSSLLVGGAMLGVAVLCVALLRRLEWSAANGERCASPGP